MPEILEVIKSIRESFTGAEHVYTNGSCYQFYKILKTIYPQAKAFYDSDHVITWIDGQYYDITGVVKRGRHIVVEGNYNKDTLDKMKCEIVKDKMLTICQDSV